MKIYHLTHIHRLFRTLVAVIIMTLSGHAVLAQNYALSFDGSGDFVNFGTPAGLQITGSQTLEMWIYPYSMNARRNPLAKAYAGEGTLTLETNGSINYYYGTGGGNNSPYQGFTTPVNISVNTWTHIAIVRDLQKMMLYWYINGVQVGSVAAEYASATAGTLPFYIGRGYVSDFHGMLDEVRVWNIARSSSEIAAFRNSGLTGLETGLAAYWPFDEGSGNTIMDNTLNGNNGTRNGNTQFLSSTAPISPPTPGAEAFEPVPPTGLPYNIVLADLTINGSEIPVGTQIGVFDGELCVGTAFYAGNPNQNLVAWQADPSQSLAGFTPGHPMTFKYHLAWYSEIRNFDAQKTMVKGNGNFGFGSYSAVDLAVSTTLIPDIGISEELLNFNTVVINQSKTLPIVLTNNGTAPLAITAIQNSTAFFTRSKNGFLLAPGATDTLKITFTPTSVVSYTDMLSFVTDDPDLSSVSIPLYGTGLPQPTPQIVVTPSSLNFGGIPRSTSKTMTLNILNPGNGNLSVTGITSSNPVFTIAGSTGFTLGQGQNADVPVVFSPTQAGNYTGTITILNNAQNVTVPVSGIASQGHFTSVAPTGKPYSIIVDNVDIDGFAPSLGDEVAVYDGSLCVGVGIAGQGGNSLALTGSNGYVINDNSTAFDVQRLTISAWVYSSNFSQNGFIFEKGAVNSQYSLFFEGSSINFRTVPVSGGYEDFYVNSSTAGIVNNQWNHIAVTFDGYRKMLYVNGQLKATQDYVRTLRTGQAGQIIGAYGGSGGHSYYFNGSIDEVRVWNVARSQFDIQSDMNRELMGTESGLIGYWNFNDGNYNNLVAGATPSYLGGNASLQGLQPPQVFSNFLITAWEKDVALGLPGFTPGNPMTFKVWTQIYSNWVEVPMTPEYVIGNGNFGFGQMTVVNLEGTAGLEPDISVPVESLYVGQVVVGSSVVSDVTISNTGNAPLEVTISDNSTAFTTSISTATIAPGASNMFQVTFTPTLPGGYSGILTIQSNDPDEPLISISLEGFALPAGSSNSSTSVNLLNFENTVVNTPKTMSFFLVNTGTTALTVTNITSNNAAFSVSPTSFTLQNTNDLKEILVSFQPGAKGAFSGTLSITSNAPAKQVVVMGIGFEDHFNQIDPTGIPYPIIVKQTNLDDVIKPGDELSVFDGNLSVGMASLLNTDKVLKLDGDGDYVEIPDDPSLDLNGNQITVEAWVRPTSYSGDYRCIIGKIGWTNSNDWSYNFHIADNGTLHFNFVNTYGTSFPVNSLATLEINAWHHVAATYNGSLIRLYIDGQEVMTLAASGNIRQNNQMVKIGSWWSSDPNYFNGSLDEVRLWNYARSPGQIAENMHQTLPGNEPGLVGNWNFESGNANDLTIYENHGTLTGNAEVISDWRLSDEPSIMAWKADPTNGLPGYTTGNPMTFKLWTTLNGFPTELNAIPTYLVGNGNFGYGQFTAVSLEFELPEITVDPQELFVALEEPDSTERDLTVSNSGNTPLNIETYPVNVSGASHGKSMVLDGDNDYLSVNYNYPGLSEVTAEAWIYPTSTSGTRWIISTGRDCCTPTGGFNLLLSGNTLSGQVWRSAGSQLFSVGTTGIIQVNQWQHVCMTYDGTQIKLFRNGVEVAASPVLGNSAILNGSSNLVLGVLGYSVPGYYDFAGYIDEARIWYNALTSKEINQNLYRQLNGNETSLIGYWNFDDGTAADLTGNGRNGTFNGNASATESNAPVAGWIEIIGGNQTVAPGSSSNITLKFNSTAYNDGLYGIDLKINNNTPDHSPVIIPVSMNVTGTPQITSAPAQLDFGQVVVNGSKNENIMLSNIGTKDLIIQNINIPDGASSGFSYSIPGKSFPLTLQPGETADVTVSFNPLLPGPAADSLVVESNAGNATQYKVPLTGTGITPPDISVAQSLFTFTAPCNDEVSSSLEIFNEGQDVLNVEIISDQPWITFTPSQTTVAGGSSVNAGVTISTLDLFAGLHEAVVTLTSNDPDEPETELLYQITITGEPAIICNDFINIGTAFVGETLTGELSVVNSGCDVLEVTSVDVQSQFPVFNVLNPVFNVNPGDAEVLQILFTPQSSRQYSGILTINSNDPAQAAIQVVVSAIGVEPPKMTVNPLEINASMTSGESQVKQFIVKNIGGQTLHFETEAGALNPYMLKLDGNGDYINVTHTPILNPANELTLEAWIYLVDNVNEFIIGKENSTEGKYRLLVNNAGKLEFELNNQFTVVSTSALSKNQWYHVAATFDGSSMKLFINGVQNAMQTFAPFTIQANTDNLRIGRSYQFTYFNGMIDEVRVWNIARNESEILSAKNQALTGTEPELILYFPFLTGSGNMIADASLYNHDGILFGNPVQQGSTVPFSDYLTILNGIGNLSANQQQNVNLNINSAGFFAGSYQRALAVSSNSVTDPDQTVTLNLTINGQGNLIPSTSQVSFDNTFVGLRDTFELIIENTGPVATEITGMTFSDPVFSKLNQVAKIFPFSRKTLKLIFEPVLPQAYAGTLTINYNGGTALQSVINLSGAGISPPIPVFNPAIADFGNVVVSQTANLPVTLTNNGSSALEVYSFSLSDPSLFTASIQLPATLAYLQQIPFNITFTPVNYTPVNAFIHFTTNMGLISLPLSGTGIPPEHDLSVTGIVSPMSNCGLSAAEQLKISVRNFGTLPQTNFQVGYKLNNGAVVTETVNGTLPSGQTVVHTFTQTLNLSALGTYTLKTFTKLANDQNKANDTLVQAITNYPSVGNITLLQPPNNFSGVVEPVTFTWEAAANATAYDVYLWRTSQPKPGTPTATGITGTSYTYTDYLNKNYLYNWQVVARNQCSQSQSEIRTFSFNIFSDLVPSNVVIPATASSGQNIEVNFTITNTGTGGTGIIPWKDDLYLSSSSIFDPGTAVKVASVNNKNGLNPGQSYTNTATFRLADYLEGTYYMFVVTDANNIIQETDENNNRAVSAMPMSVNLPPYPDITANNIVPLSGNVIPGEAFTMGWNIQNIGDAVAAGGWSQRLALVSGQQTYVLGFVQNSESVNPGAFVSLSASFNIPVQLAMEGEIYLQVRITPNPALIEKPNGAANNTVLSTETVLAENRLTLSLPQPTLNENSASPMNAMLYRSGNTGQALVVNLSASLPGRITIPAVVTIPVNQSGAPFQIFAVDNNLIEGNVEVVITADAGLFAADDAILTLVDNEMPSLAMNLSMTEANEGDVFQVTVTRDLVTANPLNVTLFTLKTNQIGLPPNLTIPANESSATVDVTVLANSTPELTENVVINATVAGYLPGSGTISILDDDLPQVTFTINPVSVSEGAGPYASFGTVTLDRPAVGNLTILISSSPQGQLFTPNQVTIPNNQVQAQFNIGVVDNGIMEGNRTASVTAAVYLPACGCSAPPETGAAVTQNITILDNDGPTLSVSPSPLTAPENATNVGMLRITRNTLGGNEININIQHNGTDELSVASTAVIPEGATFVDVPFSTLDDGIEDGDQIVTVIVSSTGYSSGSCWVIVTDRNLPDYVARTLSVSQNSVLINSTVNISFKIANQGFALAGDGAEVKIYRSEDQTIHPAYDVLISTQYTPSVLSIGDSLEITFAYTPTDKVGFFNILANVNANGAKAELMSINNVAVSVPLAILPDYSATVTVDGDVFNGTTPITISGITESLAKVPAPNKPVDVYVIVEGVRRVFNAVSNGNGEFSVNFVPVNGEAGSYTVGACYPGQSNNEAQDNFTILGARTTASGYILWDMWLNETRSFFLELKNFSPLELTNVQVEVLSGPPGCQVNFTPIGQLPGNGMATMNYTVTATELTNGTQYQEVKLQLKSAEGTKFRFSTWFFSRATVGNLKLNPVSLNKAMVRGITNYAEFEVKNNGNAETGLINILLPQNNWLSLATSGNTIPSLQPGQSAIVTLRLTPGSDLQLNNPIHGSIALNGANSNSVTLPFTFEPVSLETGNLLVDVVDEYTYNTEAAPHVTGASVILSHPYTGQIISQGMTNSSGHYLAENIPEGYYNLRVSAQQHSNFQQLIYIEKGITNNKLVFIAFQAISYTWQVIPTMIEDEYEITLVAVFETNVPAPVVEMVMPDTIPQLDVGDVFPFILLLTNHGLITAQDVEITFPNDDEYEFIANVNTFDILPQTTVQVPVVVQRRTSTTAANRSSNCTDFTIASYKFACGPDDQLRLVQDNVYYKGRICTSPGGGSVLPPIGWCFDCGTPGPGGPGYTYTGPTFPLEIPTVPYTQSNTGCDPCLAEFLNALWSCTPIPNIGIGKTGYLPGDRGKLGDAWQLIKPLKDIFKKLKCAWNIGWSIGCKINQFIGNGKTPVPAELIQAQEDMFMVDKAFTAIDSTTYEIYHNVELINREAFVVFNDSVLPNVQAMTAINETRINELLNAFIESDIVESEMLGFFERWNTSMEANGLGIYSPTTEYPNIIDSVLIYKYGLSYDTAFNYATGRGFNSIEEMYNAAHAIVEGYTEETQTAVCATVTVQFSQTLTMTREAFEGTLTIFNGHESDAMENILLDLEVRDENGMIRNDLFQINTESLDQISGIDGSGTLGSQTEGSAVIMFIPERAAAPDVPKYYSFGGTLSYLDPFTGEIFEQPLLPVTLQVNPSPNLYIDYFMQRDILGDDALTEPIEPMIPAELAVLIDNQGAGTAWSVNIESAQPTIIENEKGLLIDFEIVGSNLGGKPTQLGLLNVNFGDIPGGGIKVGQWWFTSTLLGHFIAYEISVNHLNSFGNPDLSLVSDVQIHELIKSVSVYGPLYDTINDFLVNDVPDSDDIPDALYFSTGNMADVYQAEEAAVDGAVNMNNLEVELTVTPFLAGWNYTKINDPGNGLFRIVSCTRADGQAIPLDNIWLTYVTIPDGGEPIYENKLHFLDIFAENTPQTYTVVFEAIDQNVPEVIAINGIPAGVTDEPVTNVQVVFNKPIDPATFTYEDMMLKNQGGPDLMDETVIVTQLNDTTFDVDISTKTSANGFYMLTVQTAGIADLIGNYGQYGVQASWIQAISSPAIDYFFGLPEEPGAPVDTLLVLFNMPIIESTFTNSQIILKDGSGNVIPSESLLITPLSFNNVLYKISGLLPLTSGNDNYSLTFKVTEIVGESGQSGLADQTVEWSVCVVTPPSVDAGDDDYVCVGSDYALEGTASNAASVLWTTSGTGTFDDAHSLNAVYTPGTQDYIVGKIILTLTAEPLDPCISSVASSMELTVRNPVVANAGADAAVCQNKTYALNGSVTNYTLWYWITSGNGTFDNPLLLNPVYTPGSQDIAAGSVTLSLVAEPIWPCEFNDTSSLVLTIQKNPTVNAGPNKTVCQTESVQLNATAQNYSSLIWVNNLGDGFLSDNHILNPIYVLGPNDIIRGVVPMTIYAQAVNPCFAPASSTTRIIVRKKPVVNIGADEAICSSTTHQLSATVQNSNTYFWSTTGDGTFSNTIALNPLYTFGAGDLLSGSVTLSLTAQSVSPCTGTVTASKTITIQQPPTANAGPDGLICEGDGYQLTGMVQHASSFLWQTLGDGIFSDPLALNTVYYPGPGDAINGTAELSLMANPFVPCLNSAIDFVDVDIIALPIVDAGDDISVCHTEIVQLNGSVSGSGIISWQTDGDGQLVNPTSLSPVYYPGPEDITNGTVTITLTVITEEPCPAEVTDVVILTINTCQELTFPAGWSGISTYVTPVDPAVSNMFSSVLNDLIILYNNSGMYWPGQNINTLDTWNRNSGYVIKVANTLQLTVPGARSANRTLELGAGWNLIPVHSECTADVVSLFAGTNLVMVKEVAGWKVYWPALNINTLGSLQPGKAYYVLMANAGSITFPACQQGGYDPGNTGASLKMSDLIEAGPWNIFQSTPGSHITGIPFTAVNPDFIKPGDYIGALDAEGNCFGLIAWNGENSVLVAFADDAVTPVKDGFEEGETIYFRLYVPSTKMQYNLEVEFDAAWPQTDGSYHINGISAIKSLMLNTTQVTEPGNMQVMVYPNPAEHELFIDFPEVMETRAVLLDVNGKEVISVVLSALRNRLDISMLRKGIYFLKLENQGLSQVEKIVVR